MGRNWIHDQNPFNLPPPPAWWLRQLADFDRDLVVIPSRTASLYRLTRRTRRKPGLTQALDRHADTAMMVQYGVLPVTSLMPWAIWGHVIPELKARDLWAHGGAERAADLMDADDAKHAGRTQRQIRDDLYHRGGDAWRTYTYRTGQRVSLAS